MGQSYGEGIELNELYKLNGQFEVKKRWRALLVNRRSINNILE